MGLESTSGNDATATHERLVKQREVTHRTTLSRTSIWRGVKAGWFPPPVQLTPTRIAWKESDILAWIASRAGAR